MPTRLQAPGAGEDAGRWSARPGPLGTRFREIRCYDGVDSTNRVAIDAARSGAAEGLVVTAEHQAAGRGRLGRTWHAPSGCNLLASILLRPRIRPTERHLVTAMAALSAADAIVELAGFAPLIKWPNDLLAPDGRKLAGVLAEADGTESVPGESESVPGESGSGSAGSGSAVVVGIGINVTWPGRGESGDDAAGEVLATASSLAEWSEIDLDGPGPRAALLDAVLIGVERRLVGASAPDGTRRLAAELRTRCATVGQHVRVELPGATLTGVAVDLTDEGHLVVVDSDGPVPVRTVVAAGDVVHLRAGDPSPAPEPRC